MSKDKNWVARNNKGILVVRVSGTGQEHNNSHKYEIEDGRRYAIRNDLDLVEIVQIVESAKQSNLRKEYHAAIKKAIRCGIQHILFYKVDRESRNLTDNEFNESLVRSGEIILYYVAEGKFLDKNSPDSDFLMRDYHAVQNKHYSRELSSKITRAQESKAASGWAPMAIPPLGYVNEKIRTDRGFERRRGSIIVPDPNQNNIKLVQREFELRATSPTQSLKSIRDQIILEGFIPLADIKKYHIGSIERRLKNVFYDGRFVWNGIEYKGNHERIIPNEVYGKVQETFGIKHQYGKKTKGVFQNGWMKCADKNCGCHIIYDPREKPIKKTGEMKLYKHYRCTNGKGVHLSTKGMRVTEESLIEQFGKAVEEISILDGFADELLGALNDAKESAKKAIRLDIQNFQLGLKSLEGVEDELYKDLKKKILDEELYHRQIANVRTERSRFATLLEKAQLEINDVTGETYKSILQLAMDAKTLWNTRSDVERSQFLKKLLSNQVLDGISVRYEIIKPLQTLSEMREDHNWRRERFSQ